MPPRARVARAVLATLIVGVGVFGMLQATQAAHAHDGLPWNVPGTVNTPGRN